MSRYTKFPEGFDFESFIAECKDLDNCFQVNAPILEDALVAQTDDKGTVVNWIPDPNVQLFCVVKHEDRGYLFAEIKDAGNYQLYARSNDPRMIGWFKIPREVLDAAINPQEEGSESSNSTPATPPPVVKTSGGSSSSAEDS